MNLIWSSLREPAVKMVGRRTVLPIVSCALLCLLFAYLLDEVFHGQWVPIDGVNPPNTFVSHPVAPYLGTAFFLAGLAFVVLTMTNVLALFNAISKHFNLGFRRIGYLVLVGTFLIAGYAQFEHRFSWYWSGYGRVDHALEWLLENFAATCFWATIATAAYIAVLMLGTWIFQGFKAGQLDVGPPREKSEFVPGLNELGTEASPSRR